MTEPSWTMNDTDRQIISGPYAAPTLGVDYSAPWVVGDIPVLTGLAENLYAWLGTLPNGLSGSKPRREVTVTIGDATAENVIRDTADHMRRFVSGDMKLGEQDCPTNLRKSPLPTTVTFDLLTDDTWSYEIFAPTLESPSGTIIDGLIGTLP